LGEVNDLESQQNSTLNTNKIPKIKKKKYFCSNRHNFCGHCKKIWHESNNCEDEKELLDYATDSGKIIKQCPKCKVWTEKDEGCNHMHCRLCLYDWCWLCAENCPPDHFTKPNTPCYGKQFNEDGDPDIEYYIMLQNQNSMMNSMFFFFVFTIFVINNCIRNVMNPQPNQRNNLRLHQRPSKFCLFIILCFILGFVGIFLILFNGILLSYILINLTRIGNINSDLSKLTLIGFYIIAWVFYYLFGIMLGVLWLIFSLVYTGIRLLRE